jgi:alginate O-acetyltransferase complex protein AlgI
MLFNSYIFLTGFLPLVIGGYGLAGRIGARPARGWLILASLAFYAWGAVQYLPLLVLSVLGNHAAGRMLTRLPVRHRGLAVTACVAANLGVLAWGRYASPVLPLGLSFFTFSQIGFLLDCAAGVLTPPGLADYALFAGLFPHVIGGPIPVAREMLPRVAALRGRLAAGDLAVGGGYFIIGLLKKAVLAEPLSAVVTAGFADPGGLTLLGAWQAALSWSLALYFDFSGYSDMAIGLGRMFGLRYPANFASPYKAQSVIEYWQCWHMSLTRFLMGTIHAPLTLAVMRRRRALGLRVDRAAQAQPGGFTVMMVLPIMVTMVLAGVWHGSGLTFLVFGLMHGGFLVVNHAWRLFWPGPCSQARSAMLARLALTYLCVLAGAVVFRAASLGDGLAMFGAMGGVNGISMSLEPRGVLDAAWLAGLFAIVWLAPNSEQIMEAVGGRRIAWRPSLPWAMAMGCAATLGLLSIGGTAEFVYFRF